MTKLKLTVAALILSLAVASCDKPVQSASGVERKVVAVQTDPSGWTVEQKNIADRLKIDNTPGSVKHLYIVSPYSGQVILYSTVKGKVTSSGKRLTPNTVSGVLNGGAESNEGFPVGIGNKTTYTKEVLQDDGTYGSSCEYIYWFDSRGKYHQHFFTGGQIIHVSDYPIAVKEVTINLEQTEK